jgi:hypothetical protein
MALELGIPISVLCKRYINIAKQKFYPEVRLSSIILDNIFTIILDNSQLKNADFLRSII